VAIDRGAGSRVILLCGLPGSGKTSVGRRLADELHAVRLAPDEWIDALGFDAYDQVARGRVEALQWSVAQAVVLGGGVAVMEAGFWSRRERDEKLAWARGHGVAIELRFLDVALDELWRRLAARNADLPPATYHIERPDLEEWATWLEAPDAAERAQYDPPVVS